MSQVLLHTQSLKVGYKDRCVVDVGDINVHRGDMLCLLGPNGTGKSTILRTLSGMLAPVEGKVYLENEDIRTIPKSKLSKRMSIVLTERLAPGLLLLKLPQWAVTLTQDFLDV